MTDPAIHAQALATIEQAHAAWAQVWVGAVGAFATFGAVLVALGIPFVQWQRQKLFTEATLFQAARTIISLHETLETKLLVFIPVGGLSVIRVARQRLDHTIPIVREYRMITCLLALLPIVVQIEQELERWVQHVNEHQTFDSDGFRKGMTKQAEKARAIVTGYGNPALLRRLDREVKAFG